MKLFVFPKPKIDNTKIDNSIIVFAFNQKANAAIA